MIAIVNRLFIRGVVTLLRGDDRGAHTVEIMLWIAVFIVVVGTVGAIFRDDIQDFFNNISYTIGFSSGQ